MNTRKLISAVAAAGCCLALNAQSLEDFKRQAFEEFNAFRDNAVEEYKNFRDKANADYAKFMSEAWGEFQKEAPLRKPPLPEPPKPPVAPPPEEDKREDFDRIPVKEIVPVAPPVVRPRPVEPIPVAPTAPVCDSFEFTFYGTPCRVGLDRSLSFRLTDIDERSVAAAWEDLSKEKYNRLINECLDLRESMDLCGWGYYALLRAMTTAFFGDTNEAVLLQIFIMVQSGYQVRIARCEQRLCLLMPSDYTIFSKSYIKIDGENYYIFGNDTGSNQYHVFTGAFPHEQVMSIRMEAAPKLEPLAARERDLVSKRYASASVHATLDRNLIDFYNDYPLNDNWTLYSLTSLSQGLKDEIYPPLKAAIEGKSQTEAANILINFVQTAFEYKTDGEQFGCERPLFGDETFYYPYSDCEDRSILFSILVRELMGLDVAFLYYPGQHLATVVRFDEEVPGDYLMVNDQKYIVCDPTYIGASIGRAMPNLKNSPVKVIAIQ